jgi:hypothetical protein
LAARYFLDTRCERGADKLRFMMFVCSTQRFFPRKMTTTRSLAQISGCSRQHIHHSLRMTQLSFISGDCKLL